MNVLKKSIVYLAVCVLIGCTDDPNKNLKPVDPNLPMPKETGSIGPGGKSKDAVIEKMQ